MMKDKLIQLISSKKNRVIVSILILVVLVLAVFVNRIAKREDKRVCGRYNCPTGCCVINKCIPKNVVISDYTCIGANLWKGIDSEVKVETPEEIVKEVAKVIAGQGKTTKITPILATLRPQEAKLVAQKIVSWLDSMKNDKGQYYMFETCNDKQVCQKATSVDKQLGINVVWARYRNYLNSRDQKNLVNLEKDLETLTTPDIGFPAQNDFFNCKLMYEMSQSGFFEKQSKEKIDKICIGSVHYGYEMDEFIKTLPQNKYEEEPKIEEFINGVRLKRWDIVNPQKFNKYAIYASDIAYVYSWLDNINDLAAAKYYFNMALQIFADKNDKLNNSVLGIAAFDLYKMTKDSKYLDFVNYFLDYKKGDGCGSVEDCSYYLMFLDELNQETKNYEAEKEMMKTLSVLTKNYYNEEKGLFSSSKTILTYPTLDNALLAGFLAKYGK